ncbi:MAG: tRNA (adenosine(37)-N6)-threonylcarbamoyltransferase complex transferase subunit TsaD [Chloroflexota bacterium]
MSGTAPEYILAVESSCDESAVALVQNGREVIAERVASQTALHATAGGVVPEAAARAHHEQLPQLLDEVLDEAERVGVREKISGVAVTAGPGLIGSLIVGTGLASAWAWGRGLPLIATSHLEGHFRAAWLTRSGVGGGGRLPAVALIVSGGHTLLASISASGEQKLLGTTIDDAAGEAFDKIARLLGLPYPGGAALSALAAGEKPGGARLVLPVAQTRGSLDFSFSGVKTAAARLALEAIGVDPSAPGRAAALQRQLEERPVPPEARVRIAAAAERAIVAALAARVRTALEAHPGAMLIVGGGVAANGPLRAALTEVATAAQREIAIPPIHWCTDNAAMIGAAAHAAVREGRAELLDPAKGIRPAASWTFGSIAPS